MGVELYEMRSEQAGLGQRLRARSGGSVTAGASRSMLHSKVLVMDGRLLVVGSMNLDLRSQLQNTEIALLIRSDELSRAADRADRAGAARRRLARGAGATAGWSGARREGSGLAGHHHRARHQRRPAR